jgi:RimJ/RimL family protein N-acetyltransferase
MPHSISLRPTQITDLDFVLEAEQNNENSPYVGQWTRQEHASALHEPDLAHLIIETADKKPVGYTILAGLCSPGRAIEFRRIVITEKGQGFGRQAVQLIKKFAFEEQRAHRLWLDVRDHNLLAQQLYASEGFVREGLLRDCVWVNDHFESLVLMSILQNEYRSAAPSK